MRPLDATDYDALAGFQDDRCAICRRRPGQFRALAVDHDHRTGEVRGLLCDYCNTTIGFLKEDSEWMRAAAEYLECPPTRECWEEQPRWWPDSPGAAGHDLRGTP